MILKYIIEYLSNDNAYASIIKQLADKSGYKINIVRANGGIIIYIDEDEEEIKEFFNTLGTSLPLSIHVGQSRVEEATSFPSHILEFASTKPPLMSLVKELMEMVDEKSKNYLNPFALAKGRVIVSENEFTNVDDEFKNMLSILANRILNGEQISFENENSKFSLCKNCTPDSSKNILCIDLNRVAPEYKASNIALFALSSMERPFVTILNTTDDNTGEYIRLALASDPFLLCLAKLVGDLKIDKLYITKESSRYAEVVYNGFVGKDCNPEVLIQKDRKLFLSNEKFDSTILPIENDSLVAFFGEGQDSVFLAVRPGVMTKELLEIKTFKNCISDEIGSLDENGTKLISNFETRFPGILAKCDKIICEFNFEKFIKACSIVLGYIDECSNLEYLIRLASKNRAQTGVKIDFVLETENQKPTLNLIKSFRTLLSYKIAGVEDSILAYSIFESFADFVSILSDEARKGFDAKELVLCGGIFYSHIVSDRVYTKARNIRVASAYIPQILV